MIGVPWDQGTSIGRPKRKADALAPPTPVLLPVENEKEAIPATPTAVGKPLETVEEETELQPMAEETTTSAGSGIARPWHTASGGDTSGPMDESISARRAWTGDSVGES